MPKKDKDEYNTYMREYMLKLYHSRRKEAVANLGGKCAKCGSKKRLEVDHKDNSRTKLAINKLWSVAKERYLAELEHCQLLCKECHIDKTLGETGKRRATHGRYAMYRHHRCRCALCKKAARDYSREYRSRKNVEA